MIENCEEIYALLDVRVERILLKGLYLAVFNNEKDKFYAASFVDIDKEEYYKVGYYLEKPGAFSAFYKPGDERRRKYTTNGSWSDKTEDECVAEGIYKYYSVRFTGVFHENDWYIVLEVSYFSDELTEDESKGFIKKMIGDNYWQSSRFMPYEDFILSNGKKLHSQQYQQFGNVPQIVAHLKQQKKEAINRAYIRYINEEVFFPLTQKLKINYPESYYDFSSSLFQTDDFALFFPESKKYVIAATVCHKRKGARTVAYFLYHSATSEVFKWIYPVEKEFENVQSCQGNIIEQMKNISIFDDALYLAYSHLLTLDDPLFWENYVFKKEEGRFIYLKEILV